MAFLFKRKYGKEGKQTSKWYGEYKNEHGAAVRVPLSVNKATAQRLLNELVRKAELVAAGIVDHFEDARKTPLAAHLGEFEQSLTAKGRDAEYIGLKVGRVQSVLDGCGWVYTRDIDPTRLEKFLHDLRAEAGRSTQTSNDWLQAVKQFVKWLHENGRLDRDPLAGLKGGNVRTDRRHIRRTLPTDQLAKLLDTARDSQQLFRGLGSV